MSDTELLPTVDPLLDDGDHDKFAHYVRKSDMTRAYIEGAAITALCGKKWVPTRDPDRFPVCPDCKTFYNNLSGS